ncbi:MAG TPA: glycosyltransferase [Marinagarivorans sp.]
MGSSMQVGMVVIGRNEGERLKTCLRSIPNGIPIVYVDSGSDDGSVDFAESIGVSVVTLDVTKKFTAARARNAGWRRLLEEFPSLEYVQFSDGDCELQPDWIAEAKAFLDSNPSYAIACGRRRERYPEKSPYNWICDVEWNTPVGDARACGGDALIRTDVLRRVDGFLDSLVAGEEPEMCIRIAEAGYSIRRLDLEMTLHDANIHHFGQWWKRSVRCGFAYANGASLHGKTHKHWVKEKVRALVWGALLPMLTVAAVLTVGWYGLLLPLIYAVSFFRSVRKAPSNIDKPFLWAAFMVLSKFPESIGVIQFYWQKMRGTQAQIIEYK